MVEDLPVSLVVITAGRTAPVLPNRFRGIGAVAGVESGGDALVENSGGHAGTSSGAILTAGGRWRRVVELCGRGDLSAGAQTFGG